jgi:hypothetical protein
MCVRGDGVEVGVGVDDGAVHAMKVSLSASVRQERCMAYSAGRVRGSEAVWARSC